MSPPASSPGGRSGRADPLPVPRLGPLGGEPRLDPATRPAQDGTLIPAYLAMVPQALSLEAPLGSEADGALALLELVEQRAAKAGVAVDARIERGRTPRHALDPAHRAGAL